MRTEKPIETENLLLKTLDPEAARGPYLAWMRDREVTRYLESRFVRLDRRSLEEYIHGHNTSDDSLLLGIFLTETGEHIGNIKLGPIDRNHSHGDVGVLIGERRQWGRGFATEAIRALTEHAFSELRLHRLSAGCYAPNQGSMRAFLKAGWSVEGRRPEQYSCEDRWVDEILLGIRRPR